MKNKDFEDQLAAATRRGLESSVSHVHATSVHYDGACDSLVLRLRGGMTLMIPAQLLEGVAHQPRDLINDVQLTADGAALRFDRLDADFSIQDIAAGSFGSRKWMQHLEAAGLLDASSVERRRQVEKLNALREQERQQKHNTSQRTSGGSAPPKNSARSNGASARRPFVQS